MYYTNDKGDVAKVIDYDPKTDKVTIIVKKSMSYDEFVKEFKRCPRTHNPSANLIDVGKQNKSENGDE